MGIFATFMDRRIGAELNKRSVLVWYDSTRAWHWWIESILSESLPRDEGTAAQVTISGRDAHLVVSSGSHYEMLQACEPLVSGSEPPRLLVYVPGEPYLEMLSPLRELECLGGEKEPYQRELIQVARQALQSAGLSESKIDELLNRDGLDYAYLDSISVGEGGASPLAPVFGSSRELEVLPSFLAEAERRLEATSKGLLLEVARLASEGLGLQISADSQDEGGEAMAQGLARALLVAEMRSNLDGAEPVAISQIPAPQSEEQIERVRAVCQKLRREHPIIYEVMADSVERELGLSQAEIDPAALGHIDTFRFEERCLLEACDSWLIEGQSQRVLQFVEKRSEGFWNSVSRHPERHAEWTALGDLARLALGVEKAAKCLSDRPPAHSNGYVQAYTSPDGWHRIDQRYRIARYRLARLEDGAVLERSSEHVFARYDRLLTKMTEGFTGALQLSGWQLKEALPQTDIYGKHVAKRPVAVAYILADAMRFEMGAELSELLEVAGATAMQIVPAVAQAPTITDVGMVALLPGAERTFSIAEAPAGVTGSIEGRPVIGSAERMDISKGAVPGLVEMTIDRLINEVPRSQLAEMLENTPVIVIRSQEIDGAGESLPDGIARQVMGTILEDLRKAVLRLADAGVTQFVITADHGHLFGKRRDDDMKIESPQGGRKVELHRRCWIGRGGDTPSSCVRIAGRDLGYDTDLELVVPKGLGVFKAGGSLSFHHGGLSLQELIIPVVSFELQSRKAEKKGASKGLIDLADAPKEVTNRIFSVQLRMTELTFEAFTVRVIATATEDGKTVGQASFATTGWDESKRIVTFTASMNETCVGIQLDDDEVKELEVLVVEVGTDRTVAHTSPIPVRILR